MTKQFMALKVHWIHRRRWGWGLIIRSFFLQIHHSIGLEKIWMRLNSFQIVVSFQIHHSIVFAWRELLIFYIWLFFLCLLWIFENFFSSFYDFVFELGKYLLLFHFQHISWQISNIKFLFFFSNVWIFSISKPFL